MQAPTGHWRCRPRRPSVWSRGGVNFLEAPGLAVPLDRRPQSLTVLLLPRPLPALPLCHPTHTFTHTLQEASPSFLPQMARLFGLSSGGLALGLLLAAMGGVVEAQQQGLRGGNSTTTLEHRQLPPGQVRG